MLTSNISIRLEYLHYEFSGKDFFFQLDPTPDSYDLFGENDLDIDAADEPHVTWDKVAACESTNDWNINTGNGYYGGLQFSQSSWAAAGGSGSPQNASRDEQIRVAENLQNMQGWGAWPACSSKLGLR